MILNRPMKKIPTTNPITGESIQPTIFMRLPGPPYQLDKY
jgi:hypothetical protein